MSCQGSSITAMKSQQVVIVEAPKVRVTMTLSGISSASQVTKKMEQQLIAALGDALQISSNLVNYLVKLESLKDARRRLLALMVSYQVLASSEAQAGLLSKSAMTADMQVYTYFSFYHGYNQFKFHMCKWGSQMILSVTLC